MSKYPKDKTEEEWKVVLSEEEFRILRQQGTERPHTGTYTDHDKKGIYNCKGCDTPLFQSHQKFDSGCGWPSFDEAIEGAIEYRKDSSLGMARTEIICASCGGHLGHVFNDGPTNTGQRYCVNSVSLNFNTNIN